MALRDMDDLFEMLPESASIQGPLSIGCPQRSFRSTFQSYERALAIACPILPLFAHHCGISARPKCDVPITRKRLWLSRLTPWFDPHHDFCHAVGGGRYRIWPWQMPFETNNRAVVHVVDDDASLRGALESLFESVGLASRGYAAARDFLNAGLADKPGCIVIDIRLPDMSGLEFQAQLSQMGVRLPVVMMTGYGDIPMTVRAMKRGAVDFLPKPFRDQDMLDAVMRAIESDRQRRTVDDDVSLMRQRFGTLSARERQVMMLVTAGKMNKQVAGDLGISEITVKIHRGAAMHKMGARTLADLVRMAEMVKLKEP
jgi:FixJ family two-component response regulator